MVAMVLISVLFGPPIGLDGTMTGRRPGAGHRLRPKRSGGPKAADILLREECRPWAAGENIRR